MIIRATTTQDLPRLVELTRDALSFASSPDSYIWDAANDKELTKRLHSYVTGHNELSLAVEVENALVGFVACHFDELDPRSPDRGAIIDLLAVDPEYRGRTLGTHLVQELLQVLPPKGITQINVDVLGSNNDALSFWRRAGFHEHAVTMTVKLATEEKT
jgi:ribosomal protein S18 acetylase RimI-like enzyme